MAKKKTRGDRNIAWIEAHCKVPDGRHIGRPVKLRPWQRLIIKGIYDTPTRRAIISVGRKNGKTAIAAIILLLHLVGPEARPNSQILSAAQSIEQAAVVFGLASKMVRLDPDLSHYIGVQHTKKSLYCNELGTTYRALSAEASTAYGLSPVLCIHDELGQVKGPRSELYTALETASAAHDDPMSIIISTQAATDADLMSVLIDDAKAGHDPKIKLFLHTAPEELDPFSIEAIKAANPAFGDFQNETETLSLAESARRMPSQEASYRNLTLNQRVESISPFVSKSVWLENGHPPIESFGKGNPVYCGLDLSETSDLTALVMISKIDDQWHVKPTFWLPSEGLVERARKDHVPYDLWHKQGFLETTPGKAIEYEYVAAKMYKLFGELDIRAVGFDRYNMRFLKPWLKGAGFNDTLLERFKDFGQGFISMSPALREFETILLNSKMRHGNHPLLLMCAANAIVDLDPAGNRKLSKKRSRGRIDGMVALTMAVGVATTYEEEKPVFKSIWDEDFMDRLEKVKLDDG